jgi:glycosyltransferase involved in cell wall biosynthesis/ubiquinone/menaquinone biosynthesis C-methylase UbiE
MEALYLRPTGEIGVVDDPRLDGTTERHKMSLDAKPSGAMGDPVAALTRHPHASGLIIEMYVGWVGRDALALIRRVLRTGRRVWVYWPDEAAVECVDRERMSSLRRHWLFIVWWRAQNRWSEAVGRARARAGRMKRALRDVWQSTPKYKLPMWILRRLLRSSVDPGLAARQAELARTAQLAPLDALIADASPVAFPMPSSTPDASHRIPGCGVYLRTDFWSRIESGGSYGHTCYVARELAAVTEDFVALMAHRYRLLDDYGVRQVVIDAPSQTSSEEDLVAATPYFLSSLKPALQLLKPAYIYERICLGNYAGALLSRQLQIPYIVEYNGSEISMLRSFNNARYVYEDFYERAEALAFRQATMISVVSEQIRRSLLARGVPDSKILVNPNGADLAAYSPAGEEEKAQIRAELGLPAGAAVVGFTGTFGGWHGVDVLAAALPRICERNPDVMFLLIGVGNFKHLVDAAVVEHRLESRVRMTGRVPQAEGARLLKACDIYVSPHNAHMVDSRFFGSPTKIFEYMSLAGGVVASDLEQIGVVLSPALRVADLRKPDIPVGDERSVLCKPGDVNEFVEAVSLLAARPEVCRQLGCNARQAVAVHYSWQRHVAHLWPFLAGKRDAAPAARDTGQDEWQRPDAHAIRSPMISTGDAYKDEVQRQWDNDPAGSHYVKAAERHTLEWFMEAEAYRYGDYAPWMREVMEFNRHKSEKVLEVGAGMGTDLAQFATHGALVTDVDLSSGHLDLARENFRLRGLAAEFVLHDAETLPFDDNTFDVVYSNGVIHHTPNTHSVVCEMRRVLKPGGRAIVMVYAENSLHYWRNLVWAIGLKEGQISKRSMGDIMSAAVERSDNAAARPLVKVYTRRRLRKLFDRFEDVEVVQRQMVPAEVPRLLTRVPVAELGKVMGWNLIIKARKPLA